MKNNEKIKEARSTHRFKTRTVKLLRNLTDITNKTQDQVAHAAFLLYKKKLLTNSPKIKEEEGLKAS